MKRRVLSLLLTLSLLLGLLPAAAFASENVSGQGAGAGERADGVYQVAQDTAPIALTAETGDAHAFHQVCGATNCPGHPDPVAQNDASKRVTHNEVENTTGDVKIEWKPLNQSNVDEFLGLAKKFESAYYGDTREAHWYYYLTGNLDIPADKNWVLQGVESTNHNITYAICLNGHTITCSPTPDKPAIYLQTYEVVKNTNHFYYPAKVNICDCKGGGKISMKNDSTGPAIQVEYNSHNGYDNTLNLYGGTITSESLDGTGVLVKTMDFRFGNENKNTNPAINTYECVARSGLFQMDGGAIKGTGVGVDNYGRFAMTGGEISGNSTGVYYREEEYVGSGCGPAGNVGIQDNDTLYFRLGGGAVIQNNTEADLHFEQVKGSTTSHTTMPRVTLIPGGDIQWVPMRVKYDGKVKYYDPSDRYAYTYNLTPLTDSSDGDYSMYFISDQYEVLNFVDEDIEYKYISSNQLKGQKNHVRLSGNSEDPQITVSTQPSLPSLPSGGSPVGQKLTVTATGGSDTLKYQWYYSEEDTTNYKADGVSPVDNGGDTENCTIPNLAAADAEKTYYFFCVITDGTGHKTVTNTVKVTFPAVGELKITSQPTLPELTDGHGPVGKTLSVTAEGGSGNLGYQWYYAKNSTGDGKKIIGATEKSYNIGQYSFFSANPTYFYCVVTDGDKSVTTDRVEVNFGARITQQPKAPTGNPVGKTLTVEAEKPNSSALEYQWFWNDSKTTENGNRIRTETSNTMIIPDPGEGVKVRYYYCVITVIDGTIKTITDVVTVNFSGGGIVPPVIDTQPAAPSVAEGQSPVGQTITAPAVSGGGGGYKYQWYYNTADSTTGGTTVSPDGTSASCKIPELEPGTYYFYCVVTGADGGEAVTNTVKIVIPDSAGLNPGQTITLDDGTTVNRSDDGGTVTITPPAGGGGSTVTTVTLPDSSKTGEVAVNKSTGEVSPPEGSKVTTTGGSGGGSGKPEITIGSGGGSVTPDGEVKLPEGGTATVGGGAGGSPVTTITGGSGGTGGTTGGTTVTPKDDGTVEVGQGGTVTTGGTSGGTGAPVTLPNGGSVKPEDGTVTPTDKLIATGEDNNGDGVPDTLIVLPDDNGVKPDASGGVTLPNGTQVQGGGANSSDGTDGTGGASVTLPSGGTISSDGGVKPGGDGKVTTGADGKTEVTLPTGGEVKGDGDGGLTVPGGTTVKNDTNGPTVTVGGGSGSGGGGNGGALDKDGGVKLPEGGVATVGGGSSGGGGTDPVTTITGGSGGSTVTSNPDGTTGVTGGTTVKTGDNGTEVTVNDNGGKGGKVTSDGGIQLPGGGSVTVGGGSGGSSGGGQGGTTITVPADGTGGGTTVKPGEGGKVEAPAGSKVKTETGGESTPGGGGQSGTEITLPNGGEVDATDGAVKPTGGVAGVDTDGDGKADTLITLPSGGAGGGTDTIKPNDQGGVDVPGGTELAGTTDGTDPAGQSKVVLGDKGGSVNGEGGVDLPKGGTATVDNGSGAGKTNSEITAGENGGTVKPNPDGTADVSGSGTTIQVGGGGSTKPPVAVDDKGGTVKNTGDIELKDGASATVGGEGGKPGTTITAPKNQGGTTGTTTVTPKDDGTVDVGSGGTVSTGGKNGETGTPVTLPSGGSVKPEDGAVKPTGGVAGVDTDGDGKADTLINLPSGGGTDTIKPNDQGGVDVPGGTELKGTTDGTTPDSQSKVVVGAQGGSVNGEGGVDLPKGGTATVDNGTDGSGSAKPKTEITAGENGGTVKPNPGGSADVSGSGTIIQVGGGGSTKPPVAVDDKGGTVTDAGEIELKDGASATVGGGSGKPGTTITAPKNQGGNPGSTTVTPKDDGTVDVGSGGTVTTGGKNGETGTPVTLPSGGSVKPEDGTIKPVGNTIATGEDKDGDGVPDTVIVLPESSMGITPGEDGGVKIPGGSTIQGGDGLSTTLPEGGELTPEGGVKPSGNTLTIEGGEGKPTVTIKLPEDGAVSGSGDGGLQVPPNTEIKQAGGNTPSVTVGENGGSVDKDGGVTLPAGGSATITGSNGTDSITVKTPQGGKVNTADGSTVAPEVEINGTTVAAPANGTVKTDQAGSTQAGPGAVITKGDTQVTVSEGAAVLDKDGNLTFPSGGKVEVTKNGVTQTVTIPSGGTIKPPDYSRPSSNSGSQSGSGGSGGDSDSGVGTSYAPFTKQPEHGKIKVSPSFPIAGDRVSIVITPENGYKVDTVTVTDRNGKSVTVTKQADGTYTFIQPEGGVTVSAVMKAADGSCSKDSSCPVHAFADLSVTAWYHDGVHYCLEEGLMSGYGKGTFGPQNALSRAMLAQILYSRAGYPAVSGSSPFDDVAPDSWYANAITWAADSGIVGGYGNGKFGPEDPITREQLAAMLYRCAQVEEEDAFERENGNILGYKDYEGISEYAVPALQWAVGSGIMSGKGDGILDPAGKATRAEAAVMLMQFCKLSDQ